MDFEKNIEGFMAFLTHGKPGYLNSIGSRSGLIYLNEADGHYVTMTGSGGDSLICCDGQVVKQALFKGRKSDEEDSEYGVIPNVPIPECKGVIDHQHADDHPPPGRPHAEVLAFKWACKLRVFELLRLRGEANIEKVIKSVYEKWPLEARMSVVKLVSILTPPLTQFAEKVMSESKDGFKTYFECYMGEPHFRKFLRHLFTAPSYWGPPKIKGKFSFKI